MKNALRLFLSRPPRSPRLAGRQVRGSAQTTTGGVNPSLLINYFMRKFSQNDGKIAPPQTPQNGDFRLWRWWVKSPPNFFFGTGQGLRVLVSAGARQALSTGPRHALHRTPLCGWLGFRFPGAAELRRRAVRGEQPEPELESLSHFYLLLMTAESSELSGGLMRRQLFLRN